MKIAGIILAGGKSSRYGKPKMFETYKDKHFYEYSVDALKENSLSTIVISTNDHLIPYFKQDDVDFIVEKETEAYRGPLFAMYNALSKISDAEWFFVLSCDTPFITSTFVNMMIDLTKNNQYDAIVPIQSDTIHPLLALYHRRTLMKMKQLLAKDKRKMRLLLDEIHVLTVPFSSKDPTFTNINSQDDWLKYKQMK
jgi:molybdenum cofactor guanylyltransferase